jgi:hypothetical protein
MLKNESRHCEPGADPEPAPTYPTNADIEFAEKLRRELEERYFGPSAKNPSANGRSAGAH